MNFGSCQHEEAKRAGWPEAARFLPVRVVAERHREEGRSVELLLGDGRRLRIPLGFDRQTLLDVLGLLEEQGC
jgi:hypothetical protein